MKFIMPFILLLLITVCTAAQIGGSLSATDARSAGMGNTGTASSRGIFAIGKNPANLSFSETGRLEILTNLLPLPLPSISAGVGTNFLTIKDFNYFFGGVPDPADPAKKVGRYLTIEDKQKFVDLFSDGGKIFTSVNIPWFALTVNAGEKTGSFGVSANENFAMYLDLPKGLADFAMNGNTSDSVVSFSDMQMKSWWLRDYSLSYSRDINDLLTNFFSVPENLFKHFSLGITVKYVQGFAYVGSESFNANITTNDEKIMFNSDAVGLTAFSPDLAMKYEFDSTTYGKEANASLFPQTAGTGLGFDFGITAQLNDALIVGAALTNIGNINWNTNAARFAYNNSLELTSLTEKEERDSLSDKMKKYKGEYVSEFSTALPGAFRFGVAYQLDKAPFIGNAFPGQLLLTFDFLKGFNDLPGNSTKARTAFGLEWKPMNWIPFIRTGVSMGGIDKFNWTFGIGFNAGLFDLGIGTKDFHQFLSNDFKRASVAIDTRWKF
ncbi:MAG: DUF5723 family protein [Bacillota bacterium]